MIGPPIKKRLTDWFDSVALRLESLEREVEGFSEEKLQDNPPFISVITHATNLALRNHQEEKLAALRNAFESRVLDLPDFYFTRDDYEYRFEPEAKVRFLDLLRERFSSGVSYKDRGLKWDTVTSSIAEAIHGRV